MAVYLIAHIKVTDDAWLPDYATNVHDVVLKHGGEYLSRSANITALEGERPDATVVALMKFPTMESLQAFVHDPAYAPYRQARQAGSNSVFYVIDDTDVAGTIPYLQKGSN